MAKIVVSRLMKLTHSHGNAKNPMRLILYSILYWIERRDHNTCGTGHTISVNSHYRMNNTFFLVRKLYLSLHFIVHCFNKKKRMLNSHDFITFIRKIMFDHWWMVVLVVRVIICQSFHSYWNSILPHWPFQSYPLFYAVTESTCIIYILFVCIRTYTYSCSRFNNKKWHTCQNTEENMTKKKYRTRKR